MTTKTPNGQTQYGLGVPVALAPFGTRYFDTTSAPYAEYLSIGSSWVAIAPAGGGGLVQTVLPWVVTDESGAGLVFTQNHAISIQTGQLVNAFGLVQFPVTVDASPVDLGGLPVLIANNLYNNNASFADVATIGFAVMAELDYGGDDFNLTDTSNVNITNAQCSGLQVKFNLTYSSL